MKKYDSSELDKILQDVDSGKYSKVDNAPTRISVPAEDKTDILAIPVDGESVEKRIFEKLPGKNWEERK